MKEVNPPEAYALLQQNDQAVLVDVRSTMEFEYVGHPPEALHVAIKEPPGWETRDEFVNELKSALQERFKTDVGLEQRPLLMMCRSGKRSELAANMAAEAGFTDVYNIMEGFEGDKDANGHRNTINGWRFHKLPWEQS
ncbi:MAG: rhodanese-like domain-containing protein [Gammaproteobacteria bacterium]